MTDLERMAREAGICMDLWKMGAASLAFSGTQEVPIAGVCRDELERLEALIRADERERCAKVCERVPSTYHGNDPAICAAAIRAGAASTSGSEHG